MPDAYDALYPAATDTDLMWSQAQLELAYGSKISAQRFEQLREAVLERKWSGARLRAHVKAFTQSHRPTWRKDAPAWTLADFFAQASNLKLREPIGGRDIPAGSDVYRIDGRIFWRERDGVDLPFERVTPKAKPSVATPTDEGIPMPDYVRAMINGNDLLTNALTDDTE